jgi:hypothetical protein
MLYGNVSTAQQRMDGLVQGVKLHHALISWVEPSLAEIMYKEQRAKLTAELIPGAITHANASVPACKSRSNSTCQRLCLSPAGQGLICQFRPRLALPQLLAGAPGNQLGLQLKLREGHYFPRQPDERKAGA